MIDRTALDELRAAGKKRLSSGRTRITVGLGTCGKAAGAQAVYDEIASAVESIPGADIVLDGVGCCGLCSYEPLVETYSAQGAHRMWKNVQVGDAALIVADALEEGAPMPAGPASAGAGTKPSAKTPIEDDAVPNPFRGEERRLLRNCGYIDPASIEEYVACGGYQALLRVLAENDPRSVIDEVEAAGLRGRGGAGFPTGAKWRSCAEADADERFFVVNGDEGDPGAYMDRALLESDPHAVLEGLMLASFACGVRRAYFFIRAEYSQAVASVRRAIDDAYAAGLLGEDILGSGYSLDVSVVRGAGSFLCGESTAMVNVLEGKRCTTRKKPPHMTEQGLWGKPTCINNVETLANVPLIMNWGAAWFRGTGTPESPGTKILSVTGAVERTGLVEISFGTTVERVACDIAGATNARAVQIGGPSGAILPVDRSGLEISYEALDRAGAMVGSGGLVALGDGQCVVDVVSYLVHFSLRQSCRKCRACREGLATASGLLEKICAGRANEEDLALLKEVAEATCGDRELCGLGRMALNPVLTSLAYFEDEYRAHLEGRCPGLACKELISYVIDPERCQGERCCLTMCPGNAIKGPFGKPGRIVARLCQKCGSCLEACCYGAVRKTTGNPGS